VLTQMAKNLRIKGMIGWGVEVAVSGIDVEGSMLEVDEI
jgi:hypothetical protein